MRDHGARGVPHPKTRAPETPEHEAFLNLVETSVYLVQEIAEVVKSHGLTEPQFNALRILRGAGKNGLPCSQIAKRLITRVPDVTRLVDRLERLGLAERVRNTAKDRRVVNVKISVQGRAILQKLDAPVRDIHRKQFAHLSQSDLKSLTRILTKVRSR